MSQPNQDEGETGDLSAEFEDYDDLAFDVSEVYDEETGLWAVVVGTPPRRAAGRGVSQASIDRLPSYMYTAEEAAARKEDTLTCSICLVAVEPGQKVRVLTCEHKFHAPCVDQWLLGNRTCPMCRTVVQG